MLVFVLIANAVVAAPSTAFLGLGPPGSTSPWSAEDIVVALAGNDAITLQGEDVTTRLVSAGAALDVTCDPAFDECLFQRTALCGTHQGLYASVGPRALSLRLVVPEGGHSSTVSLPLDVPSAARAVSLVEAVADLLAREKTATLVVEAAAGSVLVIDGIERGMAPHAPFDGLAPGGHTLEVRFPSGSTSTATVSLTAGRRLRAKMEPTPMTADVLVWTGAATVAAAAVAAGAGSWITINHVTQLSKLEELDRAYRVGEAGGDFNPSERRDNAIQSRDELRLLETYGQPLFIGAAVGVFVGGVLLLGGALAPEYFREMPEELPR